MEVSGHLHDLQLYPRENRPQYPLYKRMGGPQSRFGRYREEKNLLPLLGTEIRIGGLYPVAWSLYPLSYTGSRSIYGELLQRNVEYIRSLISWRI
jgi:hypothetical protein